MGPDEEPLSSRRENYELRCSLVICCAFNFNIELSSDEKCVMERDHVVKIVKEAEEALSFGDVSKLLRATSNNGKKNLRTLELF